MSRDLTESLVCCVPYHVNQPRPKRITRDEIGAPTEFRHISHMSGGNDVEDNNENELSPNSSSLNPQTSIKFNDNRRFIDIEAMRSTRTFTVSPAMCLMRLDKLPVQNTRLSTINSKVYEKFPSCAEETNENHENHENESESKNHSNNVNSNSRRNSLIYTSLTNDVEKIHDKVSSNTIPMSTSLYLAIRLAFGYENQFEFDYVLIVVYLSDIFFLFFILIICAHLYALYYYAQIDYWNYHSNWETKKLKMIIVIIGVILLIPYELSYFLSKDDDSILGENRRLIVFMTYRILRVPFLYAHLRYRHGNISSWKYITHVVISAIFVIVIYPIIWFAQSSSGYLGDKSIYTYRNDSWLAKLENESSSFRLIDYFWGCLYYTVSIATSNIPVHIQPTYWHEKFSTISFVIVYHTWVYVPWLTFIICTYVGQMSQMHKLRGKLSSYVESLKRMLLLPQTISYIRTFLHTRWNEDYLLLTESEHKLLSPGTYIDMKFNIALPFFRESIFFTSIDRGTLRKIAPFIEIIHLSKNEILFNKNDRVKYLMFVVYGEIKSLSLTSHSNYQFAYRNGFSLGNDIITTTPCETSLFAKQDSMILLLDRKFLFNIAIRYSPIFLKYFNPTTHKRFKRYLRKWRMKTKFSGALGKPLENVALYQYEVLISNAKGEMGMIENYQRTLDGMAPTISEKIEKFTNAFTTRFLQIAKMVYKLSMHLNSQLQILHTIMLVVMIIINTTFGVYGFLLLDPLYGKKLEICHTLSYAFDLVAFFFILSYLLTKIHRFESSCAHIVVKPIHYGLFTFDVFIMFISFVPLNYIIPFEWVFDFDDPTVVYSPINEDLYRYMTLCYNMTMKFNRIFYVIYSLLKFFRQRSPFSIGSLWISIIIQPICTVLCIHIVSCYYFFLMCIVKIISHNNETCNYTEYFPFLNVEGSLSDSYTLNFFIIIQLLVGTTNPITKLAINDPYIHSFVFILVICIFIRMLIFSIIFVNSYIIYRTCEPVDEITDLMNQFGSLFHVKDYFLVPIYDYCNVIVQKFKIFSMFLDNEIKRYFPPRIQRSINPFYQELLEETPFFKNLEITSFRTALSKITNVQYFLAGQKITTEKNFCHRLFIIRKGYCIAQYHKIKLFKLCPKDYFGALGFQLGAQEDMTVYALTDLEVIEIERNSFLDVLDRFSVHHKIEFDNTIIQDNGSSRGLGLLLQVFTILERYSTRIIKTTLVENIISSKDFSSEIVRLPSNELAPEPYKDALRTKLKALGNIVCEAYYNLRHENEIFLSTIQTNTYKSYITKLICTKFIITTISPSNYYLKIYKIIRELFTFLQTMLIFRLLFIDDQNFTRWTFIYICDLVSVIDIYINMITIRHYAQSIFTTTKIRTVYRSLNLSTIVEIFGTMPLEIVISFYQEIILRKELYEITNTKFEFRAVVLNRLLHWYRIIGFIRYYSKQHKKVFRRISAIILALALNAFAIVFYFLFFCASDSPVIYNIRNVFSNEKCDERVSACYVSFMSYNAICLKTDLFDIYFTQVHESFDLWQLYAIFSFKTFSLLIGYMPSYFIPKTKLEVIINTAYMCCGWYLYQVIMAREIIILVKSNLPYYIQKKKMGKIITFLEKENIDKDIVQNIQKRADVTWSFFKNNNFHEIIRLFPHDPRSDLALDAFNSLFLSSYVFHLFSRSVLRVCCDNVRQKFYLAGEIIEAQDNISDYIHFVKHGSVEVLYETGHYRKILQKELFYDRKYSAKLKESLLMVLEVIVGPRYLMHTCEYIEKKLLFSYRAKTNCFICSIPLAHAKSCLDYYPGLRDALLQNFRQTYSQIKALIMVLENDISSLVERAIEDFSPEHPHLWEKIVAEETNENFGYEQMKKSLINLQRYLRYLDHVASLRRYEHIFKSTIDTKKRLLDFANELTRDHVIRKRQRLDEALFYKVQRELEYQLNKFSKIQTMKDKNKFLLQNIREDFSRELDTFPKTSYHQNLQIKRLLRASAKEEVVLDNTKYNPFAEGVTKRQSRTMLPTFFKETPNENENNSNLLRKVNYFDSEYGKKRSNENVNQNANYDESLNNFHKIIKEKDLDDLTKHCTKHLCNFNQSNNTGTQISMGSTHQTSVITGKSKKHDNPFLEMLNMAIGRYIDRIFDIVLTMCDNESASLENILIFRKIFIILIIINWFVVIWTIEIYYACSLNYYLILINLILDILIPLISYYFHTKLRVADFFYSSMFSMKFNANWTYYERVVWFIENNPFPYVLPLFLLNYRQQVYIIAKSLHLIRIRHYNSPVIRLTISNALRDTFTMIEQGILFSVAFQLFVCFQFLLYVNRDLLQPMLDYRLFFKTEEDFLSKERLRTCILERNSEKSLRLFIEIILPHYFSVLTKMFLLEFDESPPINILEILLLVSILVVGKFTLLRVLRYTLMQYFILAITKQQSRLMSKGFNQLTHVHCLSPDLAERYRKQAKHRSNETWKHEVEFRKIFQDIPYPLRREICITIIARMFTIVPSLQLLEHHLQLFIVDFAEQWYFEPEDYVVRKNDVIDGIYFMQKGFIQFDILPINQKVHAPFWFGHLDNRKANCRFKCGLIAITEVLIYFIPHVALTIIGDKLKEKFEELYKYYDHFDILIENSLPEENDRSRIFTPYTDDARPLNLQTIL
ncbi:hypothetical protein SNEBB_003563 [Seison nebaliae]|nr:hypothetical protein SNEBB_003563 [Seison nebaliae]